MFAMIINNTVEVIENIKKNHIPTGKPFDMIAVLTELTMNNILMCVFGQTIEEQGLLSY